jgi:putative transposase
MDCIFIKVKQDHQVLSQAVYLALGVNVLGQKELLGLWISENEGAKFGLGILTELQNRGLRDIFIACVDGLSGFPEAIAAAFPKTQVPLCIIHQVRNSLKYVVSADKKSVATDLKTIYTSPTRTAAELA